MTVSDEHMDAIVSDGIAFIRAITTAYGSDTGMELWDTIASTLDPDVKGKIFFAMLTGTHEDRVTLSGAVNSANKITCIKIIRQFTGLSLTEAKNAYESPVNYGQPFALTVNPKERRHMIDDLRQNGMIVS